MNASAALSRADLLSVLPELVLGGAAVLILLFDAMAPSLRRLWLPLSAILTVGVAVLVAQPGWATSTSFGGGRCVFARPRIPRMLSRVAAGSCPRSPSLAPVSSTSTTTGCFISQSIRRNAPAEVSPLTPAFTTL